jgi:putative colanic acid biosynthesis acetyltransferase WcaF
MKDDIKNIKVKVELSKFDNSSYHPGPGFLLQVLWYFTNVLFFQNPLNPSSKLKVILLRLFGAKVGKGVVLKPSINVKYPWHLEVGDYTWTGEKVWLDSLALIRIGKNVCISQGAYLCTGNHNYKKETFDLVVSPITIEDGAWVGAKAIICPGVTLKTHSVITAGSVVTEDTKPYMIYQGNPATSIRERIIQ